MKSNSTSLFSIINPNFFGLLSGKNKSNNFLLLVETDRIFGSNVDIERRKLIDALSTYIKEFDFGDVGDQGESDDHEAGVEKSDNPDENGTSPIQRAGSFVHAMEARGWLDKDTDKDTFAPLVTRTDAFISVVNALVDLLNEEENSKEQSRFIVSLYDQVLNLHNDVFKKNDYRNATLSFQNINETSKNLEKVLLSVNSRIKRFVNKVMSDSKLGEKEILSKLVVDYQRLSSYIAFHNLLTKNNPNKFSSEIISMMQDFRLPEIKKALIQNYYEVKNLASDNANLKIENNLFDETIEKVIYQMDGIEASLDSIASKNRAYVTNSAERIKFRLNNERDIKADINNVLKLIRAKNTNEEIDYGAGFELYCYDQVDSKSLYTARAISKIAPKKLHFDRFEINENAKKKAEALLKQQEMFSVKAINEFVISNMSGKKLISAESIVIHDINDFIKMMLIPVFSSNKAASYIISNVSNNDIVCYGFRMKNYEIRAKENLK